ncbi:DNA-binding transcriptional regulator, PadR family [Paenibacillus sophorae]|uniref:DNA-binding transcriptional regulator, PadR family n=1 Tax=Paenibacillus sophorae TaxID=1333845 RepID=A0A1H8Q596_9BACL|nr:PadR family transcriptional regulator [Paenibacillus sophorae]QWU15262.1 PadR family transcriptional regulator [Paenibacillus sophorae]SEO49399.1 DNA-binding transcriptional regulator, PadR family [Paenibacillus sophorae]
MADFQETINGLIQELRRGTIIISVLSQLSKPQYGYSLVTILQEKGVSIDPGTLYPLLRRLEKQELLESTWDTNETRPRKYYSLSPAGKEVYLQLCKEWKSLSDSLESLIKGDDGNGAG